MKALPLVALAFMLLLLIGCAHMDNGFLRSAEPLQAGELRIAHTHSSSFSFAPGLELSPDSLNTFSKMEQRPRYSLQHPAQLEIGMGKGFTAGGQLNLWLGKDFEFSGYEDTSWHLAPSASGKAFLQWSARVGKNRWLAFAPAVSYYADIQIPHRNMLFKQRIQSVEYPLTYTRVKRHGDHKTSNSLTLRYVQHTANGDLKVKVPGEPFTWDEYLFDQPEREVHRAAAIYTFHYDKDGKGRFFNLGLELIVTPGSDVTAMPVFGMSWYSTRAIPKGR
jgi:hypothetical protein